MAQSRVVSKPSQETEAQVPGERRGTDLGFLVLTWGATPRRLQPATPSALGERDRRGGVLGPWCVGHISVNQRPTPARCGNSLWKHSPSARAEPGSSPGALLLPGLRSVFLNESGLGTVQNDVPVPCRGSRSSRWPRVGPGTGDARCPPHAHGHSAVSAFPRTGGFFSSPFFSFSPQGPPSRQINPFGRDSR